MDRRARKGQEKKKMRDYEFMARVVVYTGRYKGLFEYSIFERFTRRITNPSSTLLSLFPAHSR